MEFPCEVQYYYWITLVSFEIICCSPSVRLSGGNCNHKQRYLSLLSVRGVTAKFRPIFLSISVISKWTLFEYRSRRLRLVISLRIGIKCSWQNEWQDCARSVWPCCCCEPSSILDVDEILARWLCMLNFLNFAKINFPLESTTAANLTVLLAYNAIKHISWKKSTSSNCHSWGI